MAKVSIGSGGLSTLPDVQPGTDAGEDGALLVAIHPFGNQGGALFVDV